MTLRDHLNKIYERLGSIESSLVEHMRRTELNEEAVSLLKSSIEPTKRDFEKRDRLKRNLIKLFWALLGAVATAVTLKTLHL